MTCPRAAPNQTKPVAYLGLLHSTPLAGLPYALMSAVHAGGVGDVVVVVSGGDARVGALGGPIGGLGGFAAARRGR